MANLLYAEYNTGCYVGWSSSAGDYSPGDYCYGYGTNMVSYYADLEPNTTYTIQRIDTSTRFRLGLSSQDFKYLSASSSTYISTPFSWGYRADNSNAITFTTTDTATHLVVYYTNNSEYNTRVMLNKGSSIEPYEAPTRYFKNHWRLINGELINNDLPEPIDEVFSEPYPASLWRLDSDDILTLNSEDWTPFPEPMEYLTPPYPASMWYLDEYNKLTNALLPDILPLGAFALTTELHEIRLPESLEEIGPEAFYGSAIKRVIIPNNTCTYYSTSFPPDCVVTGGHKID